MPAAGEGGVGGVQRDGRAGAAVQFRGAACLVAVAVREEDERELLRLDAVFLQRGEDARQIAGGASVDEHRALAEEQVAI